MDYIEKYLDEVTEITSKIDRSQIEKMVEIICEVRKNNGRLFMLGVGGSAGNASHAANDGKHLLSTGLRAAD